MRSSSCSRWTTVTMGAVALVVLPTVEGVVVPFVGGLPLRLSESASSGFSGSSIRINIGAASS